MAIEVDNLFQALDIILDQRLANISYDKTDVCIITDASDAKNGRYWVSPNNGETRYEAYSESEEYKKGESVRVSILNGDYTQKKFIVGKYVVDDAVTPITYVSPLDTVIDVTGNMISEAKSAAQYGLISNGKVTEIPIWSADLALDQSYRDLQASGIYNTISLSAQFKTLLDNYDMRSGSFGLRLDIYTKLNPSSEKYIVRSVFMDSSEMFGNPYAFVLYTPQSRKYDLSQLGAVEKMSLWFYQKGDFSYYNANERKTINIDYTKIPKENILVKNIKIGFGSDLTIVQDNTIQAYTTNSPNYRLIVTEADNEKQLGFLWYNKDENNQYLGYSDGIVDIRYDDDGNEILINKLDKNGNKITQDVLDENGKAILEFVKDDNGKVIIVSDLTDSGKEVPTTIAQALADLPEEIAELNAELTADYESGDITLEEYTSRSRDIQNYQNVKTTYINTKYRDEVREATVEKARQAELEAAKAELDAGNLTQNQYLNRVDEINNLYDSKLNEIYNYRVKKIYILQKKQQDVMIQEIIPYDEFAYMEESETDARLTAQTGKENVPSDANSLKLSADLAEVKPIMVKTFDLVTKDLTAVLRQMRDRTSSIADITNALNTLLMTPTKDAAGNIKGEERNNILAWYDSADKLRTKMYNIYIQLLEYNYLHQENLKKLPAERETITLASHGGEDLKAWDRTALYQAIKTSFEGTLIPMVNSFFIDAQKIIDSAYTGYQGIYDTYKGKSDKIINQIKDNLNKMEIIVNDNHTIMLKLRPYNPNYAYIDYNKKDLSNYDNRYAIYWYRYEPGYTSDDRLYPTEWKRLTTKADFGIQKEVSIDEDEYDAIVAKMQASLESLTHQWMNGEIESEEEYERRKVETQSYYSQRLSLLTTTDGEELVYNYGLPIYDDFILRDGNYYFSDKVQTTNTMTIRMMDGQRVEEKYKVVLFYNHEMFESNEVVFTNLDDVVDPTTADKNAAIVITHGTNSQETYQSYGINNFLVNAADASKVRDIEIHYEGLLAGDEALAGAQVYWYIPNTATMLTCDDSHLTSTLGFFSDKDIADTEKPDYSRSGYTCYYKTIGSETVAITDDPETEEVESGEQVTAKASDLIFTYKIKDYYLSTSSRNEIFCKVIKDEYSFETSMLFAFTSLGTSGTDYTLAITPSTTQIAVYPSGYLPLDIVLYDYKNTQLPIGKSLLAENGASEFKLEWEGPTSYDGVELYGTDDSVVGANVQLVTQPSENDSLIYGVLKASAVCPIEYTTNAEADSEEDEENANQTSTRNVNLTSYYPIPYSAGNYYIEGATTIVYDSMGSNPSYYKDPYKIFTCNTNENLAEKKIIRNGVVSDKLKYDILWRIVYYKKDENGKTIKLNKETHEDYNICRNYMPTLNEKNGLNASNMYMSNMECWCAVECWLKDLETATYDTKYSLVWVQPIFILQNRYPSPMLNSWDGSLTIDKKNGTILSSLVGAGRKTRNNTFEGVLMGDVEGSAGIVNANNKSGLGIYGFNDGAQSFGFNVDGTGFIGKSGRGRILFDGNEGVIQSASYISEEDQGQNNQKAFGMKLDFDDGWIDMRGGIEYTDEDWINEILDRYKKILDAKKQILDDMGAVIESATEYVISPQIIALDVQRALLKKIEYQAKHLSNIYYEGENIVQAAYEAGEITWDDRTARIKELTDKYHSDTGELKYYAMDTLKLVKLKGGFSFEDKDYKISPKQYNTLLNELDEYILMETYDGRFKIGSGGIPVNYKSRYGELSRALQEVETYEFEVKNELNQTEKQEEQSLKQSHIRLDVKSPYFYIVSEQGKRIINIGDETEFDFASYPYQLDTEGNVVLQGNGTAARDWLEPDGPNLSKGYYLKSNDFTYTAFSKEDGTASGQGSGFLLDLTNGYINAFNLSLASKNIFIDSSNGADPFLIVKDNDGCNLIYAGQTDFYLQSHTYSRYVLGDRLTDKDGKDYYYPGMKFRTYADGDDYNFLFDIRGKLQSIIYADTDKFFLQTDDYDEEGLKGLKLDLQDGYLNGYNFNLTGYGIGDYVGSYFKFSSGDKDTSPELTFKYVDGTYDTVMLEVSEYDFYLNSKDWKSTKTSTVEKATIGTLSSSVSALNIRKGPGTNYSIADDALAGGSSVRIYGEQDSWYSLTPGNPIGDSSSRWCSKYLEDQNVWTLEEKEIEISTGGTQTGTQFNIAKGSIIMNKNTNQSAIFDVTEPKYPLQIGADNGTGLRNFRVGWDGALYGGSASPWSIDASGRAKFSYITASSGSLSYMSLSSITVHTATITDATMTSTSITDSFTFGGESYAPADFEINYADWGNIASGSMLLQVLTTGSKVKTTSTATCGETEGHTHTITVTSSSSISDGTNLFLWNKALSGRVLATGDIVSGSGVT